MFNKRRWQQLKPLFLGMVALAQIGCESVSSIQSQRRLASLPEIQFKQSTASIGEAAGSINLEVDLSFASDREVRVDFSLQSGSATGAGDDFTLDAGTLVFQANETAKQISVTIHNDTNVEDDETIALVLNNPQQAMMGQQKEHLLTILDDDQSPVVPRVSFATNASQAAENVGTHNLTVQLDAATENTVSVEYRVINGSATAGNDFVLADGTLQFNANQLSRTLPVTIIDDSLVESQESFFVEFRNPTNAIFGANIQHAVSILDNDTVALPIVSFAFANVSVQEAVGFATITVTLDRAPSAGTSVELVQSGGTASNGLDFTFSDQVLNLAAGELEQSLDLVIFDDFVRELDETVIFRLANPIGLAIGGQNAHTLTIVNDD